MNIQSFFDHWNLTENPFQAEEARNDAVYARMVEGAVTHPDFHKIFGNPENPSTSLVFGEKGSGKTAMRLMMERRLHAFNESRSEGRAWLVRYDDLNPVLDRLAHNLNTEDPDACLRKVRLSDHQDAILSLAVTELLDQLVAEDAAPESKAQGKSLRRMSRDKRLDLATLALLYDQPRHGQNERRWSRLLRLLRIRALWNRKAHGLTALGFGVLGAAGIVAWRFFNDPAWYWQAAAIAGTLGFAGLGLTWLARSFKKQLRAKRIRREIPTVTHNRETVLRRLWDLPEEEGSLGLIPDRGDQDKRYEATHRFLRIIRHLGYDNIHVYVDRIDEPAIINSDTERMRKLIWPMLNNKFLQQENFGVKMLLPLELGHELETEDAEFHRRARPDKQNLVNPLRWTGATLYDLCTWRFRNCQAETNDYIDELKDLFHDDVDHNDLVEALDQMHQPRDAFKFLYAVILRHCQDTPGEDENYQIPKSTLNQVRREQAERVTNLYRGVRNN